MCHSCPAPCAINYPGTASGSAAIKGGVVCMVPALICVRELREKFGYNYEMEIRIEKRTDISIKWTFVLKKSAPRAYCNLSALGVPLHILPQRGIPAARCWVGHPSYRPNSGWGVIVVLHMLRAALAFVVGFYCCSWSSVRTHSYGKGVAVVFTNRCPNLMPAGFREDPCSTVQARGCVFLPMGVRAWRLLAHTRTHCLDLPQEWRKRENRNEFRDLIRPNYEMYTTHCPVRPTRQEGRNYLNVH